jgi:hypothetical protein
VFGRSGRAGLGDFLATVNTGSPKETFARYVTLVQINPQFRPAGLHAERAEASFRGNFVSKFGRPAGRWFHSDFKNVALPYVFQMYQEMINRGSLR